MTIEVGKSGGGVFVPSFISGGISFSIAGASGAVLSISPPENQRVRLNTLSSSTTPFTLKIYLGNTGGTPIVDKVLSNTGAGIGEFVLAGVSTSTTLSSQPGAVSSILGGVDEDVIFFVDAASTEQFRYGYEFGVLR
jgi:hypothetical protein